MWKIFAGFIVFTLLALFVIMKGSDKVEIQDKAVAHHSVSESPSIATAVPMASVPTPVVAPAAATPSASAASVDPASQPGKMSTTGTIVVGTTAAASK